MNMQGNTILVAGGARPLAEHHRLVGHLQAALRRRDTVEARAVRVEHLVELELLTLAHGGEALPRGLVVA